MRQSGTCMLTRPPTGTPPDSASVPGGDSSGFWPGFSISEIRATQRENVYRNGEDASGFFKSHLMVPESMHQVLKNMCVPWQFSG